LHRKQKEQILLHPNLQMFCLSSIINEANSTSSEGQNTISKMF
jgi:hypothetical protein